MEKEKALKQLKKLALLEENANVAIFDELQSLNGKLKALYGSVKKSNSKDVITYQDELKTLHEAILSLTESVSRQSVLDKLDEIAKELKSTQKVDIKLNLI